MKSFKSRYKSLRTFLFLMLLIYSGILSFVLLKPYLILKTSLDYKIIHIKESILKWDKNEMAYNEVIDEALIIAENSKNPEYCLVRIESVMSLLKNNRKVINQSDELALEIVDILGEKLKEDCK